MRTVWIYRGLLVAVLLAAFWVRVFDLNSIPPGMHRDEGNYLYRQWRLTDGYGLPLYFQDNPEPFDSMVRAVMLRFTGVMPFTSRLFSVFLNVIAAASAAAAARSLFRDHPQREAIALVAALALATATPTAVIGRSIYRANWLPMASTLSLAFLAHGWRTHRMRHFVAAGIMGGIATSFYLGGLAFPVALGLILLVSVVLNRQTFPGWRNLVALGVAGGIVMLPWFYLYLRVPHWLDWRLTEVSQDVTRPIDTPTNLFNAVSRAVKPIFVYQYFYDEIRYSTFTLPFLNPPIGALCVVGIVVSLWRWRRPGALLPLIGAGVMIMPSVLSDTPETPIRMLGVFGPLALLAGIGAGAILQALTQRRMAWVAQAGLAAVLVYSPASLYSSVRYHFLDDPLIHNDPTSWLSLAGYYDLGDLDMWKHIEQSPQPTYIPIDYLNGEVPASWLRPSKFPNMHGYNGEPLPAGNVLLPVNDVYGLPATPYPVQYALMLPATGEIVVLPPLALDDATALRQQILNTGQPFINDQGWLLGHSLVIDAAHNPFASVEQITPKVIGTYDDNLELVGTTMPRDMTPDGWLPVTLYWRLRERTGQDYFVNLQIWDWSGSNRGDQNSAIFRYVFPTPMWAAGEIVAETRWVHLFPDAPPGGYRLMVNVFTHPGPVSAPLVAAEGEHQQDSWLVGAKPVIPLPAFDAPPADALPVDAVLANAIRLTNIRFDPPLDRVKPGDTVTVTLYWQASAPPPDDYILFLHLIDADGNLLAQDDAPPLGGRYPTSNWGVGERIVTTHTLKLASTGRAPFSLTLGMYSYPSQDRVTVVQKGVSVADHLVTVP